MTRPPPLLLAVESATAVASVAVLRGERLLGERVGRPGEPHSECLMPMLDSLLRECDTEVGALDGFAVSIGPGAFTSLRVGLATVKGLAFGGSQPVAPVSTLHALAMRAVRLHGGPEPGTPILAVLDARRGEFYAGAFRWVGERFECALEEGVYGPRELADGLTELPWVVGEGAPLLEALEPVWSSVRGRPRLTPLRPHALDVGRLGLLELEAGRAGGGADLVPRYLRRAEAEQKRVDRQRAGRSARL